MPYFACPHCLSPILTPSVRSSILTRLESQISERLAKEERDREQAVEEARKAAGAFPTLVAGVSASPTGNGPVGGTASPRPMAPNQSHKVLSLNAKTKKVTISSYSQSPVPSRPSSRAEHDEQEPVRVPKPTAQANSMRSVEGVKYVPAPVLERQGHDAVEEASSGRRRTRRNRGRKDKQQANGDPVSIQI